jgi:flagellar hook-basal body complex protein FliE
MDINPILGPISSPIPIRGPQVAHPAKTAGDSFASTLSDAFGQLQASQTKADQATQALASGEPIELHDVMLALEESNLTFQLGVQVRNKLVEAYQEITRMQM